MHTSSADTGDEVEVPSCSTRKRKADMLIEQEQSEEVEEPTAKRQCLDKEGKKKLASVVNFNWYLFVAILIRPYLLFDQVFDKVDINLNPKLQLSFQV